MRKSIQESGQPLFRPEEESGHIQNDKVTSKHGTGKISNIVGRGQSQSNSRERSGSQPDNGRGKGSGVTPQQFLSAFKASQSKTASGSLARNDASDLLKFARENGYFIPSAKMLQLMKHEVTGGMEHEVYALPQEGRVLKVTKGKAWGLNGTDLEGYLERMRSLNRIAPSIDARVEGITKNGGFPALVISMKQIQGVHPTQKELDTYLKEKGFNAYGHHQFQHEDGLRIGDAHPKNFIKRPDGVIIPIDITFNTFKGDSKEPLFTTEKK
jgi:hypothetical protein